MTNAMTHGLKKYESLSEDVHLLEPLHHSIQASFLNQNIVKVGSHRQDITITHYFMSQYPSQTKSQ
jgi:hypothetical protein